MKASNIALILGTIVIASSTLLLLNRHFAPQELKDFNKAQSALVTESNQSCIVDRKPLLVLPTKAESTIAKATSFIHIDKSDLVADITSNYYNTPTRAKTELLDTIMEVSAQYNINPLILYSIGHVESSMNPYEVHKEAIIDIGGKKLKVQAKGTYGIVWEIWGDKLIEAKILSNKADLFDPILATRALGFIYNELRSMPMHSAASNREESAMLRYFGGSFTSYVDRIEAKIGSLISEKLYKGK